MDVALCAVTAPTWSGVHAQHASTPGSARSAPPPALQTVCACFGAALPPGLAGLALQCPSRCAGRLPCRLLPVAKRAVGQKGDTQRCKHLAEVRTKLSILLHRLDALEAANLVPLQSMIHVLAHSSLSA